MDLRKRGFMQKAAVKKKTKVRTGRRTADYYDYNLLAAVILLVCFGLVMLYSTSSYEAQLKFEGNVLFYPSGSDQRGGYFAGSGGLTAGLPSSDSGVRPGLCGITGPDGHG